MLSSFSTKRLKLQPAGTACRLLVLTAFVSIAVISCTTSIDENSAYSLSVEEAMDFFDEAVINSDTKCSSEDGAGAFYLGNIIPNWSGHELNRNYLTGVENVEATISTEYKYRVLQSDDKRTRYTSCYQKLVVAQDAEGNRHDAFVMFLIPTNDYDWGHKKNLEKKFNNDGDMDDYSGLKLYCTLDGRLSRVNQYEDGQKIGGVYFPDIKTETELKTALEWLEGWFGNMTFQRGRRATKTGNGDVEGDEYIYIDAAIITAYYTGSTDYTQVIKDLINNFQVNGGSGYGGLINNSQVDGGSDHGGLMDDQGGVNDGGGDSNNESGKPVDWKVGGQSIVINCENLSQAQWDSLKNALSQLGQMDAMKVLANKLKENGVDFKVKACQKDTKQIKFKQGDITSKALTTKTWNPFRHCYENLKIYINCSDINNFSILEEFCHTLELGTAKEKIPNGDLEFGAKICEGLLFLLGQVDGQEFCQALGGNQDDYITLVRFALNDLTVNVHDLIKALGNIGDEYKTMDYSKWDMSDPYQTWQEREDARKYAKELYDKYKEWFIQNKTK